MNVELILHLQHGSAETLLHRVALLEQLDQASRSDVLLWLGAQAGAGKSILARQFAQHHRKRCLYLRAQEQDQCARSFFLDLRRGLGALCGLRLPQLPLPPESGLDVWGAYAQKLFDAVNRQWPTEALIVIDEARHVAATAHFSAAVEFGFLRLPRGCRVLVMSRGAAPPSLIAATGQGRMCSFDARKLLLTTAEIAALAQLRGRTGLSALACKEMQALTNGWIAGVDLLLQHPRLRLGELPFAALDAYFAQQVLPDLSASVIEQFCLLAFFPLISPSSMPALFGRDDLAFAIDQPDALTSFILPAGGDAYRFHPMFQRFLQAHAQRIFGQSAVQNL